MKWYIVGVLIVVGVARGCPTCISSLHEYTPPFFSEEFYQPEPSPTSVETEGETRELSDSDTDLDDDDIDE